MSEEKSISTPSLSSDFYRNWIFYSLYSHELKGVNNTSLINKLKFYENNIIEKRKLRYTFLDRHRTDDSEVKGYKSLMMTILEYKVKGYDGNSILELLENEEYKEVLKEIKVQPPTIHLDQFIKIIENKIKLTFTNWYINEIIEQIYEETNEDIIKPERLITKFNNLINKYITEMNTSINIYNTSLGVENLSESLNKLDEKIEESIKEIFDNIEVTNNEVVPSGIESLDKILMGGFQKQRLYLVMGKSGFGKSAILIDITRRLLEQGKSVYFFTLENTLQETQQRLISSILNKSLKEIEKDKEGSKIELKNFFKIYKGFINIEYLPAGSLTPEMIGTYIKLKQSQGVRYPDVVIVDYLDLLKYTSVSNQDSERIRLTKITRSLKQLAQEYNVVLLTPTQLNRDSFKKKYIDVDNTSESFGKITDSDGVLILEGSSEELLNGNLRVHVAKNRHGKSHIRFEMTVDFDRMRYSDGGIYDISLEEDLDEKTNNKNGGLF